MVIGFFKAFTQLSNNRNIYLLFILLLLVSAISVDNPILFKIFNCLSCF